LVTVSPYLWPILVTKAATPQRCEPALIARSSLATQRPAPTQNVRTPGAS
jgi:hypothetical protein